MSLSSSLKYSLNPRPASAKPSASPLRRPPPADLFAEFETFRSQIKREYNEKLLPGRAATLQDETLRLRAPNGAGKPAGPGAKSSAALPLRATNKENLEKAGGFLDSAKKSANPQIENLKKSLKELSAKKPEKSKESLLSSLHFGRGDAQSFRNSVESAKRPSDLKSLLAGLDKSSGLRGKGSEGASNYRFGTTGALGELESRAKLMVPSPTKRLNRPDSLLSSFELSNRKKLEFSDSKGFSGKWEEKKLLMKVTELQDLILDLNDQDFNEYSNQLVEEMIKLSSVVMTRVKKSNYYRSKYQ